MGQESLQKLWDGSGNPPGCLGWVEGPSSMSGMGWGTFPEFRDGWEGQQTERFGGHTQGSEVGRGTLPEVRDGSKDTQRGLIRVG